MLALALTGTAPQEPQVTHVGQVTVVAWPDQLPLATALARTAVRATEWPGLGRRDPGPLTLIVVRDGAQLDSMTQGRAPEWGAGVALPGSRTILLRADRPDIDRTLRHELGHLVLHQSVSARVPLWFDEGYASWAAGELDRFELLRLNLAVVRGRIPDLESLDADLRGSETLATSAYALAESAVLFLAEASPGRSLGPLFAALDQGNDFDSALQRTTGFTPGQFEAAWRRSIRQRYNWLTWLASGGLWAGIGALVILAWWLRRRRDIPRREALNEGWPLPEEPELGGDESRPPPEPADGRGNSREDGDSA